MGHGLFLIVGGGLLVLLALFELGGSIFDGLAGLTVHLISFGMDGHQPGERDFYGLLPGLLMLLAGLILPSVRPIAAATTSCVLSMLMMSYATLVPPTMFDLARPTGLMQVLVALWVVSSVALLLFVLPKRGTRQHAGTVEAGGR